MLESLVGAAIACAQLAVAGRTCGCDDVAVVARDLRQLAALDWRYMSERDIAEAWPAGRISYTCAPPSEPGIEAAAASINRCCEVCSVCGGPAPEEGPGAVTLRRVELYVCPAAADSVLAAIRELTDAIVPESAGADGDRHASTDGQRQGYRWTSQGDVYDLRANAFKDHDRWMARFEIGRCAVGDILEEWPLDHGRNVAVLRRDLTTDPGRKGNVLSFAYLTNCLGRDSDCRAREIRQLWPRLQDVAERAGVSSIIISSEDCTSFSTGSVVERSADGAWRGLPRP